MTSTKKRFNAYLLDIMLLGLILMVVGFIIPESQNVRILYNELADLNVQFTKNIINFSTFFTRYADITHNLDISLALTSIINTFFIVIYFILWPYFNQGSTFGQAVMKIKVVGEKDKLPTIKELIIRNTIINGLWYMILSLVLLYLLSSNSYFIIVTILGFIQLVVVIASVFMVIYKKDKRGLHDLISNTFVKDFK